MQSSSQALEAVTLNKVLTGKKKKKKEEKRQSFAAAVRSGADMKTDSE